MCLDLNTLEVPWALDVGADTDAAAALHDDGERTSLYHATLAGDDGQAMLRRVDADTGVVRWKVSVPGSVQSSPLVGEEQLAGLVFFAVAQDDGTGRLYCLDAATGSEVWSQRFGVALMSSPVAVYDETGSAWIVLGIGSGLQLLDAQGETLNALPLGAPVYGSPAVFDSMIAIATQDGRLHGVRIQ